MPGSAHSWATCPRTLDLCSSSLWFLLCLGQGAMEQGGSIPRAWRWAGVSPPSGLRTAPPPSLLAVCAAGRSVTAGPGDGGAGQTVLWLHELLGAVQLEPLQPQGNFSKGRAAGCGFCQGPQQQHSSHPARRSSPATDRKDQLDPVSLSRVKFSITITAPRSLFFLLS